ncbi:transmembrane protein, putative [Medicago truncatula]|uniref:Transmembrane protein, putative n=1 Tax=Medicago truncatula TaxID=3880 RepID=A0A072VBH4_MEDTR|nr:transmembrane protein, putative [Medicago truncatula]
MVMKGPRSKSQNTGNVWSPPNCDFQKQSGRVEENLTQLWSLCVYWSILPLAAVGFTAIYSCRVPIENMVFRLFDRIASKLPRKSEEEKSRIKTLV